MKRSARVKIHITCSLVSLILFAAPVAVICVILGAPTWAWVVIAFTVWTITFNKIHDHILADISRKGHI